MKNLSCWNKTRHRRNNKWLFCKKGKIENYRTYRIVRLRNFRSLANEILFSKKGLPQSKKIWSIKNIFWYYNIVCLYLNRHVQLREVEFVFQPHLPWIVTTPDGLISDQPNCNDPIGILRIEQYVQGHCEIVIFDIFYLILISLLRIKQGHASIKKVSSWRTFHKLSTTNESTRNFTKTEQVLVTFLFLFSTVWLCKHVFKKMSLSHSFIRSTAFIKTFYHLGLFEKW